MNTNNKEAAHPNKQQTEPPIHEYLRGLGDSYPKEVAISENKAIHARRQRNHDSADIGPVVGLALSGGGIRSATFSLGVLQSLASLKLLRRIDILSTVSGGGYIGSFLGGLFSRSTSVGSTESVPADDVEHSLATPRSRPLSWLRENGRYLTPGGSGDGLLAGSIVIRNWVALQLVLGLFVLMLLFGMGAFRVWLQTTGWFEGSPTLVTGFTKGLMWWSPYIFLPPLILGVWVIPIGWAYWLVSPPKSWTHHLPPFVIAAATILGCVWGLHHPVLLHHLLGHQAHWILWTLYGIGFLAMLAYLVVSTWADIRTKTEGLLDEDPILGPRQRLSDLLRLGFLFVLLTLFLALIDSFGQSLYAFWIHKIHHPTDAVTWKQLLTVFSPIAALLAAGKVLLQYAPNKGNVSGWLKRIPLGTLALAVAIVLGIACLSLFSFLNHGISWGWHIPTNDPGGDIARYLNPSVAKLKPLKEILPASRLEWLAWGFGITFVLSWAFGHTFEFLNQSSLGPFYTSMLTRAYLGASNAKRRGLETPHVVKGDDVPYGAYQPYEQGGPLHLINVTLNETCGGRSQVDQRDRHGLGMSVGPAGVSVGIRHHALWDKQGESLKPQGGLSQEYGVFKLRNSSKAFEPEQLSVGEWVGISGAAASTGMGSHTNLGFSLLCGFFNIRLGHWWRSGVDPIKRFDAAEGALQWARSIHRRLFPVQCHLSDEFLAKFPGTSRQNWYLSDGGHFENTGVYELIRRRVPLIILCDNGADRAGQFEDLTNLIRKARLDFGAEIRVLDNEDLATLLPTGTSPFGTLEDVSRALSSSSWHGTRVHATLAAVYYERSNMAESIIVHLKPSLTGDESLDVLKYRDTHVDFPQQSTADQFFDEAQWESYRKLGEHVGHTVFSSIMRHASWEPLIDLKSRLPHRD